MFGQPSVESKVLWELTPLCLHEYIEFLEIHLYRRSLTEYNRVLTRVNNRLTIRVASGSKLEPGFQI